MYKHLGDCGVHFDGEISAAPLGSFQYGVDGIGGLELISLQEAQSVRPVEPLIDPCVLFLQLGLKLLQSCLLEGLVLHAALEDLPPLLFFLARPHLFPRGEVEEGFLRDVVPILLAHALFKILLVDR